MDSHAKTRQLRTFFKKLTGQIMYSYSEFTATKTAPPFRAARQLNTQSEKTTLCGNPIIYPLCRVFTDLVEVCLVDLCPNYLGCTFQKPQFGLQGYNKSSQYSDALKTKRPVTLCHGSAEKTRLLLPAKVVADEKRPIQDRVNPSNRKPRARVVSDFEVGQPISILRLEVQTVNKKGGHEVPEKAEAPLRHHSQRG